MQSLFSRVRSSSSKNLNPHQHHSSTLPTAGPSSAAFDEFGQERSSSLWTPGGGEGRPNGARFKPLGSSSARQRTLSAPAPPKDLPLRPSFAVDLPPLPINEQVFHPLYIPEKREDGEREYGYLGAEHEVILALEDVYRLVAVVGEEIMTRAVTTPLLFSSQALDVSANRVRSLARSFLASCHRPAAPTGEAKWREDAQLAGPHELGMVLRWGLARLVRVVNGQHMRGLLDWDLYVQWKGDEQALRFPQNHFAVFLDMMPPVVQPLLANLFNIFSRLCAYSAQSGLTPIALSALFGPLLFGLSTDSLPFSQTYAAYLRSSHAAEHLILSYIRNIEFESLSTANPMPPRLKDWIRGYPVMIPPLKDLEKPRRGSKLVRIPSSRRNVRLYSSDLVRTAASWGTEGDMPERSEWQRITHGNHPPQYTDDFRKRLDIPANYTPSISSLGSRSSFDGSYLSLSTAPTSANGARAIAFGDIGPVGGNVLDNQPVKSFTSLDDMRWGAFEELGFTESDTKKLQFDLNEGARNNRTTKRDTMSWNDFSSIGFLREDAPLSDTLQFSTPVSSSINTWPSHVDDIHRKLKKSQKVLPSFGWDTSPVSGQEWTIEEGFVACWADLLLSSGWTDRREGTFREANWALVEFKAFPHSPAEADSSLIPMTDPRSASQWFLFEEFVPKEYRDQLLNPPKKSSKGLFSSPKSKSKTWKPATTLNGKPYNGRPVSPNAREAEFDAMLRATDSKTKVVSLGTPGARSRTMPNIRTIPPSNSYSVSSKAGGFGSISSPLYSKGGDYASSPTVPPKDKSGSALARFKLSGSTHKRSMGKIPSEYDPDLEFETKTASDSSGGESPPGRGAGVKGKGLPGMHSRKQSKDDAWVDILVSSGRRMGGQDAVMGGTALRASPDRYEYLPATGSGTLRTPKTSLSRARSDPDMGREDVGRAMMMGIDPLEVTVGAPYGNRNGHVGHPSQQQQQRQQPQYEDFDSYVGSEEEYEEEVMEVPRASVIEPLGGGPAIRVHPVAGDLTSPPNVNLGTPQWHSVEPSDEGDFEPIASPSMSGSRALSPAFESGYDQPGGGRGQSPNGAVRAVSPSFPSSSIAPGGGTEQLPAPPLPPPARKGSGGGIGSLIQMYAKKDEEAMKGIYEPKASRLPVRLGPNVPNPPSPSPSPQSQGATTTPPVPRDPSSDIVPPPPPLEDPINRLLNPSPARYVHGAPLHNVLEEESEEG